jgi:hypothetical protein
MERRTINIKKEVYDTLTLYCKENALKMNAWVEKLILKELVSIDAKTNKTE